MKAYKYIKREFLNAFVDKGSFQIGTLYDFRKKFNDAVTDIEEGINSIYAQDEVLDGDKYKGTMPRTYIQKGSKTRLAGSGKLIMKEELKNMYIYCVSTILDKTVAVAFETDACVEISDINTFAIIAKNKISGFGKFLGVGACDYGGREVHHESLQRKIPHLLKNPKYAYQKELRLAWNPNRSDEIKPEIVTIPDITHLLREVGI